MRVTIRPLTARRRADQRCRPGGRLRRGQPHQPTTTPAQTPASASVEPIERSKDAGDHQQHHAGDQDAVLRRVEQHGRDVVGGREVVRVDDRSSRPRAARPARRASARANSASGSSDAPGSEADAAPGDVGRGDIGAGLFGHGSAPAARLMRTALADRARCSGWQAEGRSPRSRRRRRARRRCGRRP